MTITRDDGVLGGEPRLEGTRIGVRHVADQFDVSLSAVYEALSYYYAHIEEMRELRSENDAAFDRVRETSLTPKESVR